MKFYFVLCYINMQSYRAESRYITSQIKYMNIPHSGIHVDFINSQKIDHFSKIFIIREFVVKDSLLEEGEGGV